MTSKENIISKENLTLVDNYNVTNGKNLKSLQMKSLKTEKLANLNCSKCGKETQAAYNYCDNCGAAKEEISLKAGIKNLDFKVPELKATGKIDIMYILKAVAIISLIGLLTGIILTVAVLKEPLRYASQWGLLSYGIEKSIASAIFTVGLFLWRFVTFIPFDYYYDKLYLFDTLKFMEYGDELALGVVVLFIYCISMIYIMFVFGRKLATKYEDNYLIQAAIFSGIYSLVLCITLKASVMQSIITVAVVSFLAVFAGCKYVEFNKNKIKNGEGM